VTVVLFACVHNSGRSVAARVLAEHYARGAIDVRSAGSAPAPAVNPAVARDLANRGLSTANEMPTLLDDEVAGAADVVVTMGCGDTCPVLPGKRYEDWGIDDPAGQDEATVHRIVNDIDLRVRQLLRDLGVTVEPE
jgi:arsenate reductase (thioredoxin)